jgi:bacterioferritin-associated ferredoxin
LKLHFKFIILADMACAVHPVVEPGLAQAPDRLPFAVPVPMSRCECAEVAFPEIARQIDAGASFEEVSLETGCGTTCTACLPDLRRFLASRA